MKPEEYGSAIIGAFLLFMMGVVAVASVLVLIKFAQMVFQ